MQTKFIQDNVQIFLYERSHPYQVQNFKRCGYEEADILAITSSKLVTEVEVKVSLSDFKADFKKEYKHYKMVKGKTIDVNWSTPNRFYYACPSGLIPIELVPDYAGLMYVYENGTVEIIKKAPLIHKIKCEDKLFIGMLQNLTAKLIFGCQYMTWKNSKREKYFENLKNCELCV